MGRISRVLLAASILVLAACEKESEKPVSQSVNKIMPLGASRVEGSIGEFESYRYELWKELKESNWQFDFIGTNTDESEYEPVSNESFDPDHEGRSGWNSGQLLENIEDWLDDVGQPDIVLFSSPGGNDALQELPVDETISNINGIIEALQDVNPNVTVIIEQMAPGKSNFMTPELKNYMTRINEEVINIASKKTTNTSLVIEIDMSLGFNDSMLADDIHYNQVGAEFIAGKYYGILEQILKN